MFKVNHTSSQSRARLGKLRTAHGAVKTPSYIPVATKAKIRTLGSEDLPKTNNQIFIANTYHLWLELGYKGLKNYPGLHDVMGWDKPLMTDSGGFQVFSLGYGKEYNEGKVGNKKGKKQGEKSGIVEITNKGVYFKQDGQKYFLDPKKSIQIQQKLGADIIYAFDEPSAPSHSKKYSKKAMERTHHWAKQSLKAKNSDQQIFGIIQGGVFNDLRKRSAKYIASLDFDGFGIGGAFGSSYGSKKEDTFEELDSVIPYLPDEKARHLMGIGKVDDLFKGVKAGIDLFDCVVPTREARHGRLYTKKGFVNIRNAQHKSSEELIERNCSCFTCSNKKLTKGKLRQLFKDKSQQAPRLATIHNLYFFNNLMDQIRKAVKEEKLDKLQEEYSAYF